MKFPDLYGYCESICLDKRQKEVDNLRGICLINLKTLTTNTEKFLVCRQYAQEKGSIYETRRGNIPGKFNFLC